MDLKEKLQNLPKKPGCYIFKDKNGKILYVGKAIILRNRVRSYFQKSRPANPRLQLMISKIADVEILVVDNEIEALILENNLIKDRKPKFNVDLRDDKSYPFIRITREDFPQVFVTRKIIRDGSEYYGPYTDVKNLRYTLKTLKHIFPVRSCKYDLNPDTIRRGKVKLCLDYYIKKCPGPCQGLYSKQEYDLMIDGVRRFLKGKTDGILKDIRNKMQREAEALAFEDAARSRDKLQALLTYRNNQKVVQSDGRDRDVIAVKADEDDAVAVLIKIREGKVLGRMHRYFRNSAGFETADLLNSFVNNYYLSAQDIPRDILLQNAIEDHQAIESYLTEQSGRAVHLFVPHIGDKKKLIDLCLKNAEYLLSELKLQKIKARDYTPYAVKALQKELRLPVAPRRIECFDISNIQGTDPVASMVCFIDGKPRKSEYRKFKIRVKSTPDDFAMMREVIQRRYSRLVREKKTLPDLIIVDGGKGQLSSAVRILHELGLHDQPVIGLAKRLEEVFFPGVSDAQMLPKTSAGLKLIQQLRDEAHRFAITFHRSRRRKRTLTSELLKIEGVGPQRHTALLKKFGSVRQIKEADVARLKEVGGVPENIAKNIYDYFHPETI